MGTATRLNELAKRTALAALYSTGAMAAWHAARNRRCLTVTAFHRVLPSGDRRWRTAHPLWTIPQDLFDECLAFFERHYSLISLEQLHDAVGGRTTLPGCPLLLTFDDGWADNAEGPLTSLRRREMPAVVFAVAEALQCGHLWQEPILRAWDQGSRPERANIGSRHALLEHLTVASTLPQSARLEFARSLYPGLEIGSDGEMLSAAQLRRLQDSGIAAGSHGLTHSPLAVLDDPATELIGSRSLLEHELNAGVTALSFPHGSYSPRVVSAARSAGYQLLFTSDACLNAGVEKREIPALFGRIPIVPAEISNSRGRLSPELLARWLFLRPQRIIPAQL